MSQDQKIEALLKASQRRYKKISADSPSRRLKSDKDGRLLLDPKNPHDREWLRDEDDGLV